jgi:hypothetical protein
MRDRVVRSKPLNGKIEVEEQRALAVVADHALSPEERGDARAARHRAHASSTPVADMSRITRPAVTERWSQKKVLRIVMSI